MNKNTLTFERKLYVAPVSRLHELQVEENVMSPIPDTEAEDDTENWG